MLDKKYLYNSMQHFLFPSLPLDKLGFWINRCRIDQSPLYVYLPVSSHNRMNSLATFSDVRSLRYLVVYYERLTC